VLVCQDEAFTLAAYLLGDDRAADEAVTQAVTIACRHYRRLPDHPIRLTALREVVRLRNHPTKSKRTGFSAAYFVCSAESASPFC